MAVGKTKSRSGRKTKRTLPRPRQAARSEDGVDVTLIRWMLSLTPVERLEAVQENLETTLRLYNQKHKLPLGSPAALETLVDAKGKVARERDKWGRLAAAQTFKRWTAK